MAAYWKWIDVTPKAIGGRLRRVRLDHDMSLSDVGNLVGKSANAVQHWEAGVSLPTLSELIDVARRISTDPIYLLTGIPSTVDLEFQEYEAERLATTEDQIHVVDYITADRKSIGARLRAARTERGLSMAALATAIGKSGQSIQHWEVGNSEGNIQDIAQVALHLAKDPIWLLTGLAVDADYDQAEPDGKRPSGIRFVWKCEGNPSQPIALKRRPRFRGRTIPCLTDVEGNPELTEDFIRGSMIYKQIMVTCFSCSTKSFGFIVSSTRNEPLISIGDIVVVDPELEIEDGLLALVRHDEFVDIGGIEILKGGAVELRSYNKSWPTMPLGSLRSLRRRDELSLMDRRSKPHIIGVVTERTTAMMNSNGLRMIEHERSRLTKKQS